MDGRETRETNGEAVTRLEGIDRRAFLKRTGLGITGLVLAGAASCRAETAAPVAKAVPTEVPARVDAVLGERIPEQQLMFSTQTHPRGAEWNRKFAEDIEKLGFKVKPNPVSQTRMLDLVNTRTYGDLYQGVSNSRPERVDPEDLVFGRGHSSEAKEGGRNFGNYRNPVYDKLAEMQSAETDPQKRKDLVWKAIEVFAKDYYYANIFSPDFIHVYNGEDWGGVVNMPNNGVGGLDYYAAVEGIRSKTGKKRVVYGTMRGLGKLNPLPSPTWNNEGRMVYDRFFQLDKDLNLVPWVFESYKVTNPTTWDFKLRKGQKWHDGKPLTVEDIKFTFDYLMKWQMPGMSLTWRPVKSVTILDPDTVRIETKQPTASFAASSLVFGFPIPKHIWENIVEEQGVKNPDEVNITQPIGSGPFKFGYYKKDQELLMAANKDHFRPPQVDELLMLIIPNLDSIIGRLESKEIDFTDVNMSPEQAKRLGSQKHLTVAQARTTNSYYLLPFVENLPWRDIELRKALQSAIDKEYVVKVAEQGAGEVADMDYLGRSHPWHDPNVPAPAFDLSKARDILRAAGYTWDSEGRIHYPSPNDENYKKRVQLVVAEEWTKHPYWTGSLYK